MIYYLASIPRSGSTLLASLLGQRKDTFVSKTSNLSDTLGAVVKVFEDAPATKAGGCDKEELFRTLKSIVVEKYSKVKEPIIFDKGRKWPHPDIMETMENVMGEPVKIVATVRPIAECVASFYTVDNKSNPGKFTGVKDWMKKSQLMDHFMDSYKAFEEGYEKHPERFCLIEYDNLVENTQHELDRVASFLGIEPVAFNPHIDQVGEDDNVWMVKDLHKLDTTIGKTELDAEEVLGKELFYLFQGGEFWSDKPAPAREPQPLDISLAAGLRGNFDKAFEILTHEAKINPENNRVAFNLGWYEMRKGNYNKGHKFLNRRRAENVFGNRHIGTSKPIWNGERGVNVLMELEGGFGDQFRAIRYAKMVQDYDCNVVISGSLSLAPVLMQVEGVNAIVRHEAALGVHHDYWLPSMSASLAFDEEYSDIDGSAYIPRLCESEGKIGVNWSGNPMFEHQQHRLFDPQLMFDAVKDEDCICLQKDVEVYGETAGLVVTPSWMETPSLEEWKDTQMAISRCDLVISSCTSVAHLAGAMGIETWIVVPILPYYLWALPGNTTPHYDSVTLFRQEKYGNWNAPFKTMTEQLKLNLKQKVAA